MMGKFYSLSSRDDVCTNVKGQILVIVALQIDQCLLMTTCKTSERICDGGLYWARRMSGTIRRSMNYPINYHSMINH